MLQVPPRPPEGAQETFDRVWGRVTASAAPSPALPAEAPPPALTEAQPPEEAAVPCLGAASAAYTHQLQTFLDHAQGRRRDYLALQRRCPPAGGHTLALLAAGERRHIQRLSAACFLISGVRPAAGDLPAAPSREPWPAGIRRCFYEEQREACALLACAQETQDPALRELCQDLAADAVDHARLLRDLLERV